VVDWYKDDRPAEGKKYKADVVGTKYLLTITDVTENDHAEFSIRYRNVEYSKANLKIEGKQRVPIDSFSPRLEQTTII
jgi:glycyl-tRNA synthetase (class II)